MVYITEKQLVDELAKKWNKDRKDVVKELTIPIVHQIYFDNYLENRDYVRIDLAAYNFEKDSIIFVEAENGLYLQHPQIYLPFCNELYVLCPEDNSSYREDQLKWSREMGIGVIEKGSSGSYFISLEPESRKMFPAVKAFVKSRLFTKFEKERKNV